MVLGGLQKLTLLDYPGEIAATVFVNGCNFRCPFCHNASLVLPTKLAEGIDEAEFFDFLDSRRGRLSAVCVSGGEPTLYPDLPEFLSKIRERGYLIKLDTNGYRPEVLSSLISAGLIDYVAMDIKNSPESYARTVGRSDFDITPVMCSLEILRSGELPYELRTTVVRELHTEADIIAIGRWISGTERYYLQPFKDSGDLVGGGLSGYSEAEMKRLLALIRQFVPLAQIRG